MRKILITQILLCYILVGCKQKNDRGVVICGSAMNGEDSKVILYVNDTPVDSTTLDKNNQFCLRLDSLSDGLYNFSIGNEYQYLYLEQGDSIALSTNMLNFDETLAFSGRGSKINNFILRMFLKSEEDKKFITQYYFLPPSGFTHKLDSLYNIRQKDLKNFRAKNENIAQDVWELAEISATYDLLAAKEGYAQFYESYTRNTSTDFLPENFYNHRNNLLNNSNFSYHRSFFNYAQAYINNEAYRLCSKDSVHQEGKDHYHFHKLELIDHIFGNNKLLKDNLYRNAAYAYLFNVSNHQNIDKYLNKIKPHIKENRYKQELDSLFTTAENLQKGKELPNIKLLNTKSETIDVNDSLTPNHINVLYIISSQNLELAQLIKNRVSQLKTLFPKVHYIGISIGDSYTDWKNEINPSVNEFYAQEPTLLSQKYLFYNPGKMIIVDGMGKIINAFGNIFNSNTEKTLAKYSE